MNELKIEIPFTLNNKVGTVEVSYEENMSVNKSGFDLLKGLPFDVEMCKGYPTMKAYIKDYEGTGYYNSSAWIQIITDKYYLSLTDNVPCKVLSEVDINDNMRNLGVPFFAFGYPAEIYDAPCNNLGGYAKLEWIADTFLVTQPSRINEDTISYIAGFRWGYEEWDAEGRRNVRIVPIEITDCSIWKQYLPMLKDQFACWKFNK